MPSSVTGGQDSLTFSPSELQPSSKSKPDGLTAQNETSARSFYRAMFALLENVERDVDDHVLLPAHHAAAAEFGENVARVHAIELRGVLGVAQEARMDAGEAEREALAVDPHRPVLQGESVRRP